MDRFDLGDIAVDVVLKNIKNIHLSVHPPHGRVRISAPSRTSLDRLRAFAVSKLHWIRKHQQRIRAQEREAPGALPGRESHDAWGKRYLLVTEERDGPPSVELTDDRLILRVHPRTRASMKKALLDEWSREQVRTAAAPLLDTWQQLMGVEVARFSVRRMKTRWGSCTPRTRSIRLNTDLARRPPECLEYIVVHELAHLLEPSHNAHFVSLMDRFMPQWRDCRAQLNRMPLRTEDWTCGASSQL